jgi:hypothetical protein
MVLGSVDARLLAIVERPTRPESSGAAVPTLEAPLRSAVRSVSCLAVCREF